MSLMITIWQSMIRPCRLVWEFALEIRPYNIATASAHQHGLILHNAEAAGHRKLLLLHGAGIAGELTWTYVTNYLKGWKDILIPDFAGMGKSRFSVALASEGFQPKISDFAQQINELLQALDWQQTDIAGYSFGGLVTEALLATAEPRLTNHEPTTDQGAGSAGAGRFDLVFLLEPAFLAGEDAQGLLRKGEAYARIAANLASAIENNSEDTEALMGFLNEVSPNRVSNPKVDRVAVARLRMNRQGLCQALAAVSHQLQQRLDYFSSWQSPRPGMSFVGAQSTPEMQPRQRRLERESDDWFTQVIEGADHSLVFTHPRQIAKLMDERLDNWLSAF